MGVGGMMRVKGGGDGDEGDLPPSAGSTGLGVAGCGSWVCGSTSLSTPRKVEEGEGDVSPIRLTLCMPALRWGKPRQLQFTRNGQLDFFPRLSTLGICIRRRETRGVAENVPVFVKLLEDNNNEADNSHDERAWR